MSATIAIQSFDLYAIVTIQGRIISDDGLPEAIAEMEQCIQKGTKNWICDTSEMSYCNSTGLNFFIKTLTKARNAGGDCALVNLQPAVQKLFELSKLNEIFTSYASLEEAVARYNTIA